ncbi:GNAT family N-acetyltransferase [Actinomadura sp. GTD37]|uniref:GNAT family N-acetyltransferase n=1 Tax=Actinomadura sp. GTD37 TaxID=1778030 RepID=UPI0035C1BC2C
MESPELLKSLQERAARGQPAEHVEDAGGWWLRLAPHCSWWVETVLPHGDVRPGELIRRIAETEKFYAAHDAVPRFQLTPQVCPEGLDAVLEKRGYRRHGSVSLQVASAAAVSGREPALKVRLDERPTREWFETWQAVNGYSRAEWEMLARIDRLSAYASALIGDEVVAVGRAVADTGWAGVFSMVTLPRARGKGAAHSVLTALSDWAAANNADRLYLQVERDNTPALRLYGRAGFAEICTYHYRDAV